MLRDYLGYVCCKIKERVYMQIAEGKLKYYESLPYRYKAMNCSIDAMRHLQNIKKSKTG